MAEAIFASAADLAVCRATLRHGSRTFFVASLGLPSHLRDAATALYSFCRLSDDAVDLHDRPVEALAQLRERLDRAYASDPLPLAFDRALAGVVAHYAIPRALPEALLEGFEWDARGRRYEDLSALKAYAARVAGSVGAMMALLMGVRGADLTARACDLGVAMQLTNIARDVGEDARAGRLYLPLAWLREARIDPDAWLARPQFSTALGTVIQRLLSVADALYDRADAGIARLPLACRPGMYAARLLYAEIGREVEGLGLDSVSRRAVVGPWRKMQLVAGALLATARPCRNTYQPALDEVQFLVDAVASTTPASPEVIPAPLCAPWWNVSARCVWLIELVERLERREHLERLGTTP